MELLLTYVGELSPTEAVTARMGLGMELGT